MKNIKIKMGYFNHFTFVELFCDKLFKMAILENCPIYNTQFHFVF